MPRPFVTRRAFLAAAGAAIPALAARKYPPASPANIVLILADELPASMLGCYGNTDLKTPNIDALARRGVRFQSALASSKGGGIGRASLFSGRTAMQNPAASDVLLTDVLSGAGYDVGYVGTWGVGAPANDRLPGHGIRWAYTLSGEQMYWNGEASQDLQGDAQGDAPSILGRRAGQFLEQQKSGSKPFFLTVSNPSSAGIAGLDRQVEALVGKLRERGIEENTMILLTSSGGSPEALRTPLIYCWPGHAPVEATRPDIVAGYDLIFTICEAANVPPPAGNLCGRSYLPIVRGRPFPKKSPWHSLVFGSFGDVDTVSDNRFKLVIRNEGRGVNQLFDLRSDPKQLINQYGNRTFVTTRDQLRRNLNQWKTQYSR